ncbi:class II aldolase/adducin family protein [Jannaschia aquimarina]|uniref:FucA_2 protein n=1 Tax=Jannaschia aquimarina TaxID=935700 RepID=A0A0D1EFH1_9RHOB|nr:class II aldolase/adducin family protein [Jannaschia aquimarina]KIT15636.1 L-fuculose phosphate aldolase [Jannaschia aquimarina]SNT03134.1 L-fuculose-phosphate aldolase [Jannaschia aquimarina]
MSDDDPRAAILAACRAMNASGLNQGTSGNVSVRDGAGMIITPSGVPYDETTPEMIVPVDAEGRPSGPLKPSSEWRMHLEIYRAHPEAGAVVHVHSPYATALSCHRRGIGAFHYMVAVAGGTDIRCADYATFGTQALSEAMLAALEGRRACLLANHGQIAFGPTLDKALWLAGEVETLARQYILAAALGEPAKLDEAQMAEVLDAFVEYGRQPDRESGTA